jgi:hypothetical protein
MTTPPRPRARRAPKPVPDPQRRLPSLRARRDRERAALARPQGRLLRAFHAYEKQLRLVARLGRRVVQLEGARRRPC